MESALVEILSRQKLKTLQSDNGREYTSTELATQEGMVWLRE